jgi:glucose-1-phosphate cytidylyltransferase
MQISQHFDISNNSNTPLKRLACEGQLCAYKHSGFWHAMDTLRDKMRLEELWRSDCAPLNIWNGMCAND